MTTRKCTLCYEVKPLTEYGKRSVNADGLERRCKPCVRAYNNKTRVTKLCPECLESQCAVSAHRCQKCYLSFSRRENHPRWAGGRSVQKGYVYLSGYSNHPSANSSGNVREHTLVMERLLGRHLVRGESVHHKNGDRGDNRPENLELWSTSQPAGQRVEDKLQWALELVELYAPERLK